MEHQSLSRTFEQQGLQLKELRNAPGRMKEIGKAPICELETFGGSPNRCSTTEVELIGQVDVLVKQELASEERPTQLRALSELHSQPRSVGKSKSPVTE